MPAIDTQRGRPVKPRRPKRRPVTPAPADVKSQADLGRAKAYKRTPAYRRDVKQVYEQQSPQRQAALRRASQGRRTVEARAIRQRAAQRAAETRDIKSEAELRRGKAAVAANIREARLKYLRRNRGIDPGDALRGALLVMGGGGRKTVKRRGAPGATVDVATLRTPTATGSLFRPVQATSQAFLKSPGKTSLATAKGLRDTAAALPPALARTAVETFEGTKEGDPLRGVKHSLADYAKDLKRRYGPLSKPGGVEKFAKRVQKEGAAGELLDLATAGAAVTGSVGRAAGASARRGQLGARAKRVATEPRPRERVSGGVSKERPVSENLAVAVAQKLVDRRRAGQQGKKVSRARARQEPVPAILAEAVERGELAPRRRPVRALVGRTQAGEVVARQKGRAREQQIREQSVEVDLGARKALSLSRDERAAFKYAMQLGIRNPATARKRLTTHREQVRAQREIEGTEIPATRRRTNDEIAVLDRLIERADKAFTPALAAVVRGEQRRERRVAAGDPGLDPVQAQLRRYLPQAIALGVTRQKGESDAKFLRRTIVASGRGKPEGLERPGYFPSEYRPEGVFSSRAVGGTRAVASPKRYTGALFRTGREAGTPDVFERGLARGIKRKHNWNLVAKQFDAIAFDWGRNGKLRDLLDEAERRGVDLDSIAFHNPRKFRERQAGVARADAETERTGRGEEPAAEGVEEAVKESTVTAADLASRPEDFKDTTGWTVVDKAGYDELHAETRPSGIVGRGADVLKGKQSRILLGLSPSWLQFQVASNAVLTGLAGVGPADFVKAQVWWNKLSEDQKAAVEPYVGIGHFADVTQQTRLGAASNAKLVNAYRAFKATPFMQRVGRGNPLDLLFKADQAQNNAFRRAVLYSKVKDDAYKRMGQNTKRIVGLQTELTNILRLGPEEQMAAILRDHRALERHAEYVNDFLGDYTTYTARERRILGRNVMFYGFLRFSLRFAFYTLPVKHPMMTSILGQMGRMEAEEIKRLLGGDELPWGLGKLYFRKDGKLQSVDLSRANPVTNAIVEMRGPKDIAGFFPPVFASLVEQMAAKTIFSQKEWKVEGEATPRKHLDVGATNRLRIFADQMLSLAAPYRALEKATQEGPQGAESMLFSARPTQYRRGDIRRSIREQEAQRPEGVGRRLLPFVAPFLPQPDTGPEQALRIRENRAEERKRIEKGKRRMEAAKRPRRLAPSAPAREGPQDRIDAALDRIAERGAIDEERQRRIDRALEALE